TIAERCVSSLNSDRGVPAPREAIGLGPGELRVAHGPLVAQPGPRHLACPPETDSITALARAVPLYHQTIRTRGTRASRRLGPSGRRTLGDGRLPEYGRANDRLSQDRSDAEHTPWFQDSSRRANVLIS